jgi:type VI secretion system secreted protein Hcp
MSSDSHLKFDGVDGESTHKDHKGEIQIMSWSWGVSNASGAGSGGGSGKGKAVAQDFEFTHLYDKASPVLAKSCVKGQHFKTLKLTSRKAGDGQKDFLVITMKEVFITGAQTSGSAGGDVVEQVHCSYKDVEFTYKPQDDKGGLGGDVKFGWDIATTETR